MRITQKDLQSAVHTMNSVSGRPQGYEKGAFVLGAQNGGYSIDLLMENRGQKRIFGTEPASLLYTEACAWIAGHDDAKSRAVAA